MQPHALRLLQHCLQCSLLEGRLPAAVCLGRCQQLSLLGRRLTAAGQLGRWQQPGLLGGCWTAAARLVRNQQPPLLKGFLTVVVPQRQWLQLLGSWGHWPSQGSQHPATRKVPTLSYSQRSCSMSKAAQRHGSCQCRRAATAGGSLFRKLQLQEHASAAEAKLLRISSCAKGAPCNAERRGWHLLLTCRVQLC